MNLAPILLFVYGRPEHTRATLKALSENTLAKESDLFVFADAPKKPEHADKVKEVREIVRNGSGFRNIKIIEREKNFGLAASIIDGISSICKDHDRFIVIEDDIVTSPFFLEFMNNGLEFYKDRSEVMQINGFFFPHKESLPESFFYNHALCWGWASWKSSWDHFTTNEVYKDLDYLIDGIKNDKNWRSKMYLKNAMSQLVANKNGEINTWAARWQAVITKMNGKCLTPGHSLTNNIGNDGSGEHSNPSSIFSNEIFGQKINVTEIPESESIEAIKVSNTILKIFRGPLIKRIIRRIKKYL